MELKVLSVNIMHARRKGNTSLPLAFQAKDMRKNIADLALEIKKEDPDIVALQEVDGPALLNGRTDQFEEIHRLSGFPYAYFAPHTRMTLKNDLHVAGTAILSKHRLENPRTHFFSRTFPTPRKGYAAAEIVLPRGRRLTFVSAHFVLFDYRRSKIRLEQSEFLIKNLALAEHPLIIAGDFNCGLDKAKELAIPTMMDGLGLHAFEPRSTSLDLMTFPAWNPKYRIDWVLPSRHFRFLEYAVRPHLPTDHAGVSAKLFLD